MEEASNSGERIPREFLHQHVDERLQTKHVQTLQFVKEIAAENKELKKTIESLQEQLAKCKDVHTAAEDAKERITKIQEDYLQKADEVNAMLTEKHQAEIMQIQNEKIELEKYLSGKVNAYKDEVMELERKNQQLLLMLEGQQVLQHRIDEERQKNKSLLEEILRMKQESSGRSVNLEDMGALQAKNIQLTQEVQELTQKNMELNIRINRLEKDGQDNLMDQDKTSLIENLKIKITQMQKDRGIASEREKNLEKQLQELMSEYLALRDLLSKSEYDKNKWFTEYQKVLSELTSLKKQFNIENTKTNFRDFVSMKRELNAVSTENSELRRALKIPNKNRGSLPKIKYEPVDSDISGRRASEPSRRGSDASQISISSLKSKEQKKHAPLRT